MADLKITIEGQAGSGKTSIACEVIYHLRRLGCQIQFEEDGKPRHVPHDLSILEAREKLPASPLKPLMVKIETKGQGNG